MLRTIAQGAGGLVLVYAVACRFLRMRGQATPYALVTYVGLAIFAAYNAVEPWSHSPDNWYVICGCMAIGLLMTSTRGRWIDGLPDEFRRKAQHEAVVHEQNDVGTGADRSAGSG